MREPIVSEATVGGVTYDVAFTFEFYDPPRPGAFSERRLKEETTCALRRQDDGRWVETYAWCSVGDRYQHLKGIQLALDRALTLLVPPDLHGRFHALVLPPLANRESVRQSQQRKRSQPGVRALRRQLHVANTRLALIGFAARRVLFNDAQAQRTAAMGERLSRGARR